MSSSAVATARPSDAPAAADEPQSVVPPPMFTADVSGEDRLGRAASARLLADLASHPGAATPFLIAIHGSAGSGKSSLVDQILERLHAGRGGDPAGSPLAVRIDASNGIDAATALRSGLFAALRTAYPDLADEAVHAGSDPVKAARIAGDRVSDLRRQLDAERQTLDGLGGRQGRLADTVLFDTPGSRVDSYARANRGRIEGRLRAFGLPIADPVATYKDLVRETAESERGASRFGMALRSLWAFKGQGTLIVLAILLFGLGWGSTDLSDNPDLWVGWLNGLGDRFAGVSAWAQDHAHWLVPISHAAFALATLAILLDIIRAFRFIQPVMRGASLLNGDLEARRRDIDGLLAHQTRRVDQLAAEVEAAVRTADAADRRVENRRAAGLLATVPAAGESDFSASTSSHAAADAFLTGLGAGMAGSSVEGASRAGPARIVVALDDLDSLPADAAAAYLDAAHRLLRRTGFVSFVAVDRHHVLNGFSETDPTYARARLGRCTQLSYDLDAEGMATLTLGAAPGGSEVDRPLERPWQDYEARLLRELAAFAGPNPRAAKRFVNGYRVARADPKMAGASPAESAGLALALALDESAVAAELMAYEQIGARPNIGEPPQSDLDYVLAAAERAISQRFSAIEARRGLIVSRIYSRRG